MESVHGPARAEHSDWPALTLAMAVTRQSELKIPIICPLPRQRQALCSAVAAAMGMLNVKMVSAADDWTARLPPCAFAIVEAI